MSLTIRREVLIKRLLMKCAIFRWVSCLAISGVALLLSGCGGGGGSGDGVRPLSLNGVTFNFGGARLTFSTATPNATSSGTEIGGFVYEKISEDTVTLTPVDNALLDAESVTWAADVGGSSRYEYTPIDGKSGRLLIYGDNLESGTMPAGDAITAFDVYTLTFTDGGGIITAVEAVMIINFNGSGVRYTTQISPIATLGTDGSTPVPTGWNGIYNGPGFIADPSFDGKTLSLKDDLNLTETVFGSFVATTPLAINTNNQTEAGGASLTHTQDAGNTNLPIDVYDVTYDLVQPFGTERVIMTIDYVSGTGSLPGQQVFTLNFLGGQKLTVTGGSGSGTIDVRTGTYTTNFGGSGTFILNRAP